MQFICPDCRGKVVTQDGQTAQCVTHGGQYRVLFSRWRPPPVVVPPPEMAFSLVPGAACAQHPSVPADFVCRICGTPVCGTCAFPQGDGMHLCPSCAVRQMETGATTIAAAGAGLPPPVPVPPNARCVGHPHLPAAAQCAGCGAFMCPTCDFSFPDGRHYCPACATSPKTDLSGKRKKKAIWSMVLAAWCAVVLVALLSGAFASMATTDRDQAALGGMVMLLLLLPSMAGLSLGLSAVDRRRHNPPIIWIGVVVNGLVLGTFLLLILVGNLMKD